MTEAARQHARILAAFTGSDWSPPSKKFLDEVSTHPDFVNPLLGDFVFLKVDFPTRVAPSAELKKQNDELRARCGVTTYPALVVLNTSGEPVATVDLTKESTSENYRATVIAAVTDVRDLLKQQAPPVEPPKPVVAATPAPAPVAEPPKPSAESIAVGAAMSSARWDILLGLSGGGMLVAVLLWWLWRTPRAVDPNADARQKNILTGLGLSGLPTAADLGAWPLERVQLLVTGLFEAGGYQVTRRTNAAELELTRADDPKARVIACCWAGAMGQVHAKAMRELFGSLIAEDIANGWFIAVDGFSDDARAVAQERSIVLIDGAELTARLRQLPKMALMRILGRAGA